MPANQENIRISIPGIIAISVMLSTFLEVLDTTSGETSPLAAHRGKPLVDDRGIHVGAHFLPGGETQSSCRSQGWLSSPLRDARKPALMFLRDRASRSHRLLCGFSAHSRSPDRLPPDTRAPVGGSLQPLSAGGFCLKPFPPEDRGKSDGVLGTWASSPPPVLGPVLGGWLTDTL